MCALFFVCPAYGVTFFGNVVGFFTVGPFMYFNFWFMVNVAGRDTIFLYYRYEIKRWGVGGVSAMFCLVGFVYVLFYRVCRFGGTKCGQGLRLYYGIVDASFEET